MAVGQRATLVKERIFNAKDPKNVERANAFAYLVKFFEWLLLQVFRSIRFGGASSPATTNSQSKKGSKANPGSRSSPPVSGSKSKVRKEVAPANNAFYVEGMGRPETEKKIRALRKKLRDIESLFERAKNAQLDVEAEEKVASKPEFEAQLEALKQQAIHEAHEIANEAAAKAAATAARNAELEAAARRSAEGKAAAAAALSRARREALEVLANISPTSAQTKNDPRVSTLLQQVSALSLGVFDEDCVSAKKSGWRLSLLARPILEEDVAISDAPPEDPTVLLGFVVFRFRPDLGCMQISNIAVPEQHRGRGFGRHLMEWICRYAKQDGSIQLISLSALPGAVKFYQAFGFKKAAVGSVSQAADDDDFVEGQVYMEYRLKGDRRKAK